MNKKNLNKPLVSIVMPVYNSADYLLEAVESIISQTYKNWELIAVDDCSTDETPAFLENFAKKDKRIKVFKNSKNKGVAATANFAIKKAKGKFIARMDADDISYPTRIEKQVQFLLENNKVIAVGGQCDVINKEGEKIGDKTFPLKDEDIREMIFTKMPIQQPTIMINTNLLPKKFVWYDKKFTVAEELELMFKFFKYGELRNLADKVLFYRIHGKNISLVDPKKTFYMTLKTRIKSIRKYGYRPSFRGVFVTAGQSVLVTVLPNGWIYPIYAFLRGMKKYGFSIFKPSVIKVRLASIFA